MSSLDYKLQKLCQKLANADQMIALAPPAPAREYACRKCNDRGFIEYLVLKDGETHQVPPDTWANLEQYDYPGSRVTTSNCECVVAKVTSERVRRLLNTGAVPERFHDYSFATWDALPDLARAGKSHLRQACEFYAELTFDRKSGDKPGLALSGMPGLGKTGLASCVVMERARRGQQVLWIDWKDLLDKCISAVRHPEIDITEIIDAAGNVQFLFLDDLGDMKRRAEITDFTRDTLYSIISRRYNRMRELLLTTNLSYEQLEDMFGERIASRIYEMCAWLTVDGLNLRKE